MTPSVRFWIFLMLFSILIIFAGHLIWSREGILWSFIFILLLNSSIFFLSDSFVLSQWHGVELEGRDPWGLLEIINQLHRRAGIQKPKIYLIDIPLPNGFSLGHNHNSGTIVISQRLIDLLNREELNAFIAFHLARIKRLDTLATSTSCAISMILTSIGRGLDTILTLGKIKYHNDQNSEFFFTKIFLFISFLTTKLIVTQKSYTEADKLASSWINNPHILAELLWKLNSYAETCSPSISYNSIPLFFVYPFRKKEGFFHYQLYPSIEKRIKNLVGRYPI